MDIPEKVVNAAWGIVGTLAMLTVSNVLENRQAIAILDSKVIEVGEMNDKLDRLSNEMTGISSRLSLVRGDISDLQEEQRKLWAASARADHRARCDDTYVEHRERQDCYLTFTPTGLE